MNNLRYYVPLGTDNQLAEAIGGPWTNIISNSTYGVAHPHLGGSVYVPASGWGGGEVIEPTAEFAVPVEGTIEAWIKADGWTTTGTDADDTVSHTFFWYHTGPGYAPMIMFAHGTGYTYDTYGQGNWHRTIYTGNTDFTAWTHFAITWSFANSRKRIWIDGVKVDDDAGYATTKRYDGSEMIEPTIATPIGNTTGFDGWICEYKFLNEEKTNFSDRFNRGFGGAKRRMS